MSKYNILFCFDTHEDLLNDQARIFGKLHIDRSSEISITYVKEAEPEDLIDSKDEFCVYGQTTDGEKFTAINCFDTGSKIKFLKDSIAIKSQKIIINRLFMGAWIDTKDLKIKKASIRFTYLEYWLNSFKIEKTTNDNSVEKFTIYPDSCNGNLDVKIDNFTIASTSKWCQKTDLNCDFNFKYRQYLSLEFKEEISFQDYDDISFLLLNFFKVILPHKTVSVEEEYIYHDDSKIKIYEVMIDKKSKTEEIKHSDFLYHYSKESVEKVLQNWFNINKKYGRVLKILSGILNNNSIIYTEYKFLSIIQWYEGFCRIRYPASDDDAKARKLQIKDIIDQIEDEDDKKFIEGITKHSHEKSFRESLKLLFEDFNIKDTLKISRGQMDGLLHYILKARNDITHPKHSSDLDYKKLAYTNEMLKNIAYAVLCKLLEIEPNRYRLLEIERHARDYYELSQTKKENP